VNGDELRQRFLDNERMTFDELMALYAWSCAEFEAAKQTGDEERRDSMGRLVVWVYPKCGRAQRNGTSHYSDRGQA
jgi:hypothetical protein